MSARIAQPSTVDFGAALKPGFSYALARSLAYDLTQRRTGEGMALYQQRIDRAADVLLSASVTPGNPLACYLHRFSTFTAQRDRAGALASAARQALLRKAI